ncbi:MAG TPA: winged helix-turn-helix domain-containing protein [Candidatus Acidoferrales bacterium]|nr:winged helix-turn-helix domain-containing protein [Candidatus Acidoferrales bacterium]
MSAPARIRFEPFEVYPAERQLWKHGTKLKLHGQPFQILVMLLERPGEILTREDIRKRLWPSETFVDFEHSVNTAVKKLRQALGDSAQAPRYVETLPGVGYRFIPRVEKRIETLEEDKTHPATNKQAAVPHPHIRFWYKAIEGTAATILMLVFLAYYYFYPLPAPRAVKITEITQSGRIDSWGGLIFDGARLLFLERAGGHWNLMQTSAKGGPAAPFPAPFRNTRLLDISPDNSQLLVASFIERGPDLPLWVMPLQGGPPRRLGNINSTSASWDPSGEHIVYASGQDLVIVDNDGLNPRKLLSVPGFPSYPAWSPDRRTLRFTVNIVPGGRSEIWEATGDGKNPHALFARPSKFQLTCCGRWTPDGRYFIFTAKYGRQSDLWAIEEKNPFWRRRGEPVELNASPNEIWYPVMSRDGHTAFAFAIHPDEEIARINVATGKASPVAPMRGMLAPFYSPDGQWMAYSTGSPRTIWRSKADGSSPLQLTDESLNAFEPRWSPDGKKIVFVAEVASKPWKTYVIPADGGKPQPALPEFDNTGRADWSPDGEMLVLEARKEPDPVDIDPETHISLYVLNLASGEAYKIPGSDGFIGPRWSPNGNYIAATNAPNNAVMIYDVEKREWKKAATGTYLSALAWSKDDRYLYYQDVLGENEPLYRIRMTSLTRDTVFDFHEILSGDVFRCGFIGLDASGSPIFTLSRSDSNIYAIDLDLP